MPRHPFVAAHPHRYGSGLGCVYCDAPGTATGEPCAVAEAVELDCIRRIGRYEPVQHLHALVKALERREDGWSLTHTSITEKGTPWDVYVVRRGEEVIATGRSVVGDLAARQAGARLWRWRTSQR